MSIRVRKRTVKVKISFAQYGSESWTKIKVEKRRLEIFEMWRWQRLLRVSWTEFSTDDGVLNELGEP